MDKHKVLHIVGSLAVLVSGLSAPAFARNMIVAYAPTATQDEPMPAACKPEMRVLAGVLNAYPVVDGWTFVVACDERAWSRLMAYTYNAQDGNDIYGATSQKSKTVILRGPALLEMKPITGPHIILHELAHASLGTSNEARAERQALSWLDGARMIRTEAAK